MRSVLPQNDNAGAGTDQQPHFDTVFGADIIYDEKILDVLFSTVETLLGGPLPGTSDRAPGVFVVGYRRRTVPQPLIFEAAERHGFASSDVESLGELFIFVQAVRDTKSKDT